MKRIYSECYTQGDPIGWGTFGEVFKAKQKETEQLVAVKKIKEVETVRDEILILSQLDHINVIKLLEVTAEGYMVFEFGKHDLLGLNECELRKSFPIAQLKCYAHQFLCGLTYCHEQGIIHRDLKPENIVVTEDHILKILDFGGAIKAQVVTNGEVRTAAWYRAPELFLIPVPPYDVSVDVWAAGCTIAELLLENALFFYEGSIKEIRPKLKDHLKKTQKKTVTDGFIDLLEKMLDMNPKKRITSKEARDHYYFLEETPLPCKPSALPRYRKSFTGKQKIAKGAPK